MNFYIIEKCLEDYLECLYRNGTNEEQQKVIKAISELSIIKTNMKNY